MVQHASRVKASRNPYRHNSQLVQKKTIPKSSGIVFGSAIHLARHSLGNPSLVAQIVRVPLPLAIGRGKIKIAEIPFSQDISKLMPTTHFEFTQYYLYVSFHCFERDIQLFSDFGIRKS